MVTEEETTNYQNEDLDALRMKNVFEFGKFSFELEEKREQGILNQSGQMLTAFSLFSAAILMALPLVVDYTSVPGIKALYLAAFSLTPLVASLVLATIAQWRFKYQTMQNAEEFEKLLYQNRSEYMSQSAYDYQWSYQLSAVQKSKKKINDIRVKLVKASMICFWASVVILVVGNVAFFIVYT